MPSLTPEPGTTPPIDAGVRIGHVHLKVSDIERGLAFWRDVQGFEVMQRRPGAVAGRNPRQETRAAPRENRAT